MRILRLFPARYEPAKDSPAADKRKLESKHCGRTIIFFTLSDCTNTLLSEVVDNENHSK